MKNIRTFQITNYPKEEIKKLKKACVENDCKYVDILVPAVTAYLKNKKK